MRGERFDALRPLLLAQPYIQGIEWSDTRPPGLDHDFTDFRLNYRKDESLAKLQADHVGITEPLDTHPWLVAPRNETWRGRAVFARSPRYSNGFFPWFALVRRYPDAIFVGTPAEHDAFQAEFGCRIQYVPTRDLLELASILAVAKVFCGNQSCPWWIACGLGVTTFQETWDHDRNSIIERANAHYMTGPVYDLEKLPP